MSTVGRVGKARGGNREGSWEEARPGRGLVGLKPGSLWLPELRPRPEASSR